VWHNTLQVVRDPLFGIALSLFLASGFAERLLRGVLLLGGLAAFIWLLVHNQTFADFTIAVVGAVGRIVVVLLIVLAIVAVALIACIGVMYVRSERSPELPRRRPQRLGRRAPAPQDALSALGAGRARAAALPDHPVDADEAAELLAAETEHVQQLTTATTRLLEPVGAGLDEDNPLRLAAGLARGYFTGLTPHRHALATLHAAGNDELDHLAQLLPALIADLDVQPLTDAAHAAVFLPNRPDWAELTRELDLRVPYLVLRVFCLKHDWRELATVLYKCYYAGVVLAECDDELDNF
jgi:hypothetical protein